MNNDMFLERQQLGHIRRTFQQYLLGKQTEDGEICVDILKCLTVAERAFLRKVYLPSSCSMDDWVMECAKEAGITRGYGWLILRIAEARFAKAKGWK